MGRFALFRRFDLWNYSRRGCGQAFGVTRERIRQIELASLARVGAGLVRIGAISQAEVDAEKLAKIRKMSRRGRPLK